MQPSEYNRQIKIRFGDDASWEDYKALFPNPTTNLESGWTATKDKTGKWILTHDKTSITAIPHENGLEVLIDPLKDIGVDVASTAIISLMTLLWNKWRSSRTSRGEKEPSYVVETVLERFPDGSQK